MKNYLDVLVGYYKKSDRGGYYRAGAITLKEFLARQADLPRIQEYRKTGDKTWKAKITAYSPAGDYGDKRRLMSTLPEHTTGLVQLDFDGVKLPKKLFDKYKWIAVAQPSASGNGFYLLVNTPDPLHYEEYWQALVDFFLKEENLVVDPAVSSINEIRYGGVPSEAKIRPDATEWVHKKTRSISVYEDTVIAHDGEAIPPNEGHSLRYEDLISLAGKNNANGVPVAKFKAVLTMDMFKESTSITSREKLDTYIDRIYEAYAEQHGEVMIPIIGKSSSISLPGIKFKKEEKINVMAYKVVKNIFNSYMLKTDNTSGVTYKYNTKFWEVVPNHELRNFLSQCAIASGVPAIQAELTLFRDLLQEQLQDITKGVLETPKNMFNLQNGVLCFTEDGVTFEQHSDTFNFTYCLPYDYDPENTTCPIWDGFFNWAIPDEDTQETFWQYLGSGFLPPSSRFEKTLILLGTGANGKSTIINTLRSLFGDAVGYFKIDKLTSPDGDQSAKQVRFIYNKVFGVSQEDGRIKDFTLWRDIVSRHEIEMKSLYKDTFMTTNYGRLISCMNDLSYIDSHLHGSSRRLIVIPMNSKISDSDADLHLNVKIATECSAILNKVIAGYIQLQKLGGHIGISAEVTTNTAEVIEQFDAVLQFLREKQYYNPPEPISKSNSLTYTEKLARQGHEVMLMEAGTLYGFFQTWCEGEGLKVPAKRIFLKRLRTHGLSVKTVKIDGKSSDRWVVGVGQPEPGVNPTEGKNGGVNPTEGKKVKAAPF